MPLVIAGKHVSTRFTSGRFGRVVGTLRIRQALLGLALLLTSALFVCAQVQIGDNLSMNLNGQASAGYTGDYGNVTASDHGINVGGNANLTGSYYDPNFISFNVNPFLSQSRLNSSYASTSNASGVNASASIFSGSQFPGTISFSKVYNADGTFGIPGSANYTTNGNSQAFGVGWGINLPEYPSLSLGYQQGSNDYSIYGENGTSTNNFRSFTLHSFYQLEGFQLNGGFQHSTSNSEFPQIFSDDQPQTSNSDSNSFNFGVAHRLPWHGGISANFTRSDFDLGYGGSSTTTGFNYSGTVDTLNGNLYFNPVDRLSVGATAIYTDNLLGSLLQTINSAGGILQQNVPGESAHSLDITGYATYQLSKHWNLFGSVEHRDQTNLGGTIAIGGTLSSEVFTGTAAYTNSLFGGVLSALIGLQQDTINAYGNNSTVGLINSVNYSHEFGRISAAGGFNYAQNTQTVLVGYTTSNFGYSGNLMCKLGQRWRWSVTTGGSKSLLNSTGYSTYAQNYSTSLSGRWIGLTAAYTKSNGNALLAGSGLVSTPVPPVLLPSELIFYGGDGWSIGLGSNPLRRLAISANYSKAYSTTSSSLTPFSNNRNEQMTVTMQYQLRQLYFNAGYSRLMQSFSASSPTAALLGSYYFGIQRWFNFF